MPSMRATLQSILFLTTSILLLGCFADTPQKVEVTKSVNKLLKEQNNVFIQIVDTFQKIKSHSTDWELEYFPKRGVRFYSHKPFETYEITFADYKNLYYVGIDTTTSPCYVEDFTIPSDFKNKIEAIDVYKVRIVKNTLGRTDRINFYFKSEKFPPITRTVILSYFPGNIPDKFKTSKEYIDELNWQHIFDNKYLLRSVGDN